MLTRRRAVQVALMAVFWFLAATTSTVISVLVWFARGEPSYLHYSTTSLALLLSFPLALPPLLAVSLVGSVVFYLALPVLPFAYAVNSVLWALATLWARDYWRRRRQGEGGVRSGTDGGAT